MISPTYSLSQSLKMLNLLGKNKTSISMIEPWPDYLKNQFHTDTQFFFRDDGTLIARLSYNEVINWKGPIPIDEFWTEKISRSLSFECARYLKSLQEKRPFKNIGHLVCKFFKFNYLPSSILDLK